MILYLFLKNAISNRKYPFRLLFILYSLFFSFLSIQSFGQTYFFEYIKKVNFGLASDKVYAVMIHSDQKVWMGTDIGLSIFDGKNIQNFSKANGLAEHGINVIYTDSRGMIWMGHRKGGISRYNGKNFESRTDKLIFKENDINSICEDADGNLWITSVGAGAIKVTNPNDKLDQLQYEQYKGNRLSDVVFYCYMLSDKKMYFVTNASVIKYFNPTDNSFENLEKKGLPTYFQITCLLEDKEGNLWIGTHHGGLYQYVKKQDTVRFYDIRDGLASNFIWTIFQDHTGDIWVGHYEGGGITRLRNGEIISRFNKDNGLNDYNIYSITEDREGNILIGTKENGLVILKDESFTLYINNEKLYPSIEIWSIIEDKDKNIWFGTNDGIVILNPREEKQNKIKIVPGVAFQYPTKVRFIKEDQGKNLWFGTSDYGVLSYNVKTKKYNSPFLSQIAEGYNLKVITALEVDNKNQLWIGTRECIYLYDITKEEGQTLGQADGLKDNSITAIYIDKNNIKYIGSETGLTVVKDLLTKESPKHSLSGTPTCITGDTDGNIWIGTQNQGVLCFKNNSIIKQFTHNDGLLSDVISFVKVFNGSLYVGTGLGMNKIDLKTNIITTYTKSNGLPGTETKPNAVYVDSQQTLWIGTVSGAVRYSPQYEKSAETEPLPMINRVIVKGDTLDIKGTKHFRYNQNNITLDFSCISLTNQDAVIFKYLLEGSNNNEWQTTTTPQKSYEALQPGTYTFKIIARNYAGVWSTKPAEFTFVIRPPWWNTWWFITACIIIGLIILFIYIKAREKQLIKEKRVLEEKVKERTIEIVNINRQLELKNKDITDSIHYASRIQNAILPPELPFENSFVLFKPKDIVSGDFFWFMAQDNVEWFAAVDCTGHGVPGAFMSIIGHNSLHKILKEYNITQPAEILNQLNEEISITLHQYHKDNQIHDGMDIALASYDKETHTLEFAGAFNPLWLIRNNEIVEIRANRYAIGLAPDINKNFTNNTVKIENGDTIYMFSDGYADQFGGPDNKKLKIGYFKEILLGIQHLTMAEQKIHLDKFIEKWRGNIVQIDDILIIGRRFEV